MKTLKAIKLKQDVESYQEMIVTLVNGVETATEQLKMVLSEKGKVNKNWANIKMIQSKIDWNLKAIKDCEDMIDELLFQLGEQEVGQGAGTEPTESPIEEAVEEEAVEGVVVSLTKYDIQRTVEIEEKFTKVARRTGKEYSTWKWLGWSMPPNFHEIEYQVKGNWVMWISKGDGFEYHYRTKLKDVAHLLPVGGAWMD